MKQKITVLGDGAWGTAIAHTLAIAGSPVSLWCYDDAVAHDIIVYRENKKYLSGITVDTGVTPTTSIKDALNASIIFVAIPVTFLRHTLAECIPFTNSEQTWIFLSKGIEQNTLAVSSTIAQQIINPTHWGILSGPSYARDLAQQQITGFTYASESTEFFNVVQTLFPHFCTFEYSTDVHGIQFYGALKNILALGMGIIEGAGYTDNTRTLFFVRAFNEITRLIEHYGGEQKSQISLAGLGDALLTGYGAHSKNKKLGILLGSGKNVTAALKEFPTAPESINTIQSVQALIHQKNIEAPLLQILYEYVHNSADLKKIMHILITGRNA